MNTGMLLERAAEAMAARGEISVRGAQVSGGYLGRRALPSNETGELLRRVLRTEPAAADTAGRG